MNKCLITIGAFALAVVVALWVIDVREAEVPTTSTTIAATTTVTTTTTASTTTATSTAPANSGVHGAVSLGPTCPVERMPPDPACADKPYATAIVVYHSGSNTPFMLGNSDAVGAFSFSLAPGSYTLKAGGTTMLPRCNPVQIAVINNAYATTTISCDTGIR